MQYDPMEFDIADYKQRVYDRCDDYEVRLDASRVGMEIERLRSRVAFLEASASWEMVQAALDAAEDLAYQLGLAQAELALLKRGEVDDLPPGV